MASYTITTTDEQETALAWQYGELFNLPPGLPPSPVPPPATQAEYLQQLVSHEVLDPIVTRYNEAQIAELVTLVATVPPENRPAAFDDIEEVVIAHGGTAPFENVSYLWSTSTAPPPRDRSIEADVTQANMSGVTKVFFDHLDANGVNRMTSLMAIAIGSTIRITDPANAANVLAVRTIAVPIQRQGADGHVEIGVQFVSFSGAFADTQPVLCSVQ